MPLASVSNGSYEVLSEVGAVGMGEVSHTSCSSGEVGPDALPIRDENRSLLLATKLPASTLRPFRQWFPMFALMVLLLPAAPVFAQEDRVHEPVDSSRVVTLSGNVPRLAQPQFDQGRIAQEASVGLVTLSLTRTAAQQAELDKLLQDQQDRSSPNYHHWLTQEQYAERFGASANDCDKVASWLRSQGLIVDRVARGRNWITFSGSARNIETALHTELHRYLVNGAMHFAMAIEPSIPEAFAPVAGGFTGLDDFGPAARPKYTNTDGSHSISPGDFATIYDSTRLYSLGINGAGQEVAIAGNSDVLLSDIRAYRAMFGLAPNDPQTIVYGPDPGVNGNQSEITGDIEVAMAAAPGAGIVLVATSNPATSAAYAVDDMLAPVISMSFGFCEELAGLNLGYQLLQLRAVAQQANAQGITWVASAGDSGATGCEIHGVTAQAKMGLSASYPASFPEVTGAGGAEFVEGSGVYWSTVNIASGASALSYIPEAAWNESSASGILAGGGGPSVLFPKPGWQTGPGIPRDGARDTPDIAFAAGCAHDPFITIVNGNFSTECGTSAATPEFAGVLALLNQYLMSTGALSQPGLGNVNPALYRLAQTSPNAFHDITVGNNIVPCVIGTLDCITGSEGFEAGSGYDLATGLGTIDIYNLVTQWNTAPATSITTVSTNTATLALSGNVSVAITVASSAGSVTPTGTVTLISGSQLLGTATLSATTLAPSAPAASATLTVYGSQLSPGNDTITAVYSGDANLNSSAATIAVNVTVPTTNSAIIPTISPNPVYELAPDSNGNRLFFTITLNEAAGVGTTLTNLTIDGVSQPVSNFFNSHNGARVVALCRAKRFRVHQRLKSAPSK